MDAAVGGIRDFRGTNFPYYVALHTRATSYKQVGGLGKPASLQAYFKGPSGNNRCKYRLLPLSSPKVFAIALINTRVFGKCLYCS